MSRVSTKSCRVWSGVITGTGYAGYFLITQDFILHWARDQLQRSGILVERVPTELNSADLGSKALDQRTHWRLAYTLMTPCKIVYTDVAWDQSARAAAWCPTGAELGSPWLCVRVQLPQGR